MLLDVAKKVQARLSESRFGDLTLESFDNPYDYVEENDEEKVDVLPSEFTEYAVRVPVAGGLEDFRFADRRYLRPIYDTPSKRRVVIAGRQVEKSTLLGNQSLAYMALIPHFRVLYVSTSHTQTKVFSRDRIKEPMEVSPILAQFTSTQLLSNVLEKKLVNGSQITLRFAFLNADRCRGIPADYVNIDEFQDIMIENVPVIEECASHSKFRMFTYSGTPKSLGGSLEHYWSKYSTQNEWVVPCRSHTPMHWNILSEDNIGKNGLICDKCSRPIHAMDPDAQWASMNPEPDVELPFEGFRLPQLMVPWIEWRDILDKQRKYSRAKFYNEVLGRSYDSGTRPLTQQDLRGNCNNELSMDALPEVKKIIGQIQVCMGIDWGTGESSYTVITLGAYLPFAPDRFTIFYWKRCEGREAEPKEQLSIIRKLVNDYNIRHIGADYGGGHWPNDELLRDYGSNRVHKYQWVGNVKKKISYEPSLGIPRFLCHRTEIMSDYFNALKRGDVFMFPRWPEFKDPFAADHMNIFSEFNDRLRMNVYKHAPGMPDDSAHSAIFCFLCSFFFRKRPDVVLPRKELQRQNEIYDGSVGDVESMDIDPEYTYDNNQS